MHERLIWIMFISLVMFPACNEEPEMITGRITGRMSAFDQTHSQISDRTGIEVTLLGLVSEAGTDITDSNGGYSFEDIPYGKYRIRMKKEGFVEAYNPSFIYHAGGYSPTYVNMSIFEVPTYEIYLDSIGYYPDENEIILNLKVDGDTVMPRNGYGYPFIAYAGADPDVSKDNYITMGKGALRDYWVYYNSPKVAVHGEISRFEFVPQIKDAITGTVYLRIYPLANGQGYGTTQFYRQALGKPSNVIIFEWNDISGK